MNQALQREQFELLGVDDALRAEFLADSVSAELIAATAPQSSSSYTLRWRGRFLHSRHDPVKECQRQLADFRAQAPDQLVLFFGAGLGYILREFARQHANPIVWFEPFGEIAARALAVTDLRDLIRAGRLTLLTGLPDDELLRDVFAGRGNREILFVSHRASYAADPAYAELQKRVESFLNKKDVNLATLSRFDRSWARNLAANFVHLARARPVRRLFGLARGHPALVCGAGPSLANDLEALRAVRDGCVLIAVDTALHILLQAGLDPDIVVTVDPQPVNRFYLEGCEASTALFVADPTTCYLSLRLIPPERLFYTWSPFPLARLFFDHVREQPGEIAFGGSVSTNAYDLALKLGCRQVFIAGQDLAFTGGQAHAKGAILEERLNLREERLFRREMHNYRQLSALPVRTLPGARGPVRTNDKLVIFHAWFNRRFAADREQYPDLEIRNVGSDGAEFVAAPRAAPADVALPGGNRLRRPRLSDLVSRAPVEFDRAAFVARLLSLADAFREFARSLEEGVADSRALYELARRKTIDKTYRRLNEKMQALDARIHEQNALMDLAGSVMQRVIFQITENFRKELTPEEAADPHVSAARQSWLLYEALFEAAHTHARWLDRAASICGA